MKFLVSILVVAMMFITTSITAQNKEIKVTVANVSSDTGKVGFALYQKEGFMIKPVQSLESNIVNGKSVVVFKNVLPGEYSVVCFHDKNENGKMDFSAQRMPLEDYGSSNNVMAFAPPTFEGSKFTLGKENIELDIKF